MATTYTSADAIADVNAASYPELKDRFAQLARVVDAVGAERKALFDEIRRREKEVAIRARLGTLSEADKIMFRDIVNSPAFSRG